MHTAPAYRRAVKTCTVICLQDQNILWTNASATVKQVVKEFWRKAALHVPPLQQLPLPLERCGLPNPRLTRVSWGPAESVLDRFSRFSAAHRCDQQTDTDHGTSVTMSRISALSGEAGPLAARGGGQICALKRRSEGVRGCGTETDGEPV